MTLAYDRVGDGAPMLLLHGIGSRRQVWAPVVAALAERCNVIVPDLPGHGASSLPADVARWDVQAYTDALEEFIVRLDLDRPHVGGNSLGGAVALELARRGMAAAATAISPIGFWSAAEVRWCVASLRLSRAIARAIAPGARTLTKPRAARALLLGQMYGRPGRIAPDAAADDITEFARSPAFDVSLPYTRHYRFRNGHQISAPLTIAWGTRDWLLVGPQSQRARELLPSASHVRLRGCGHVAMRDDPRAVVHALLGSESSADVVGSPGAHQP